MKDTYLPASVWTYPDALAVFFGGLVGSIVVLSLAISINGGNQLPDVTTLLLSSGGQALVQLGMLAYMSKSRGTSSWDLDFGFRFERSDAFGLFYGVLLQIAVVVAVQVPMAWLLHLENPPQQDVATVAGEASSLGTKVLVFVVLVMLAPLTEELLYRGVLLSRIRRDVSAHAAVAISAAVFAGIHLIDPNAIFAVPGLFVIGVVLGYQALHTERIGLTIATHAGVNLLAAIAILFNFNF
jgi:membrane protease YdiL (CAAX protease family)